jgi:monoamine oxidase
MARDARISRRAVLVLEARDRVGGRTLNRSIGTRKVVEVGGQWIGPTQDHIAKLAGEPRRSARLCATSASGRPIPRSTSR